LLQFTSQKLALLLITDGELVSFAYSILVRMFQDDWLGYLSVNARRYNNVSRTDML